MKTTAPRADVHHPVSPPAVVDVLGFPVRSLNVEGLIDLLTDAAARREPTTVCYLNAHTWNLARNDASFRRTLMAADVLYADGISVVWASRRAGAPLPRRLTAADYFGDFARRCADRDVSVFLLGGQPGVPARVAAALQREHPGLRIAGTHSGFFDLDSQAASVVAAVNAARPDVLLVGMGSPRQERWLFERRDELTVPVRWCVGALFDYVTGLERRAPAWLCRIGCEWLFRLMMDPRGKWRRYLVGNARFVWNVWRDARSPAGEGSD